MFFLFVSNISRRGECDADAKTNENRLTTREKYESRRVLKITIHISKLLEEFQNNIRDELFAMEYSKISFMLNEKVLNMLHGEVDKAIGIDIFMWLNRSK